MGMSVYYVYGCRSCGHRGETRLAGDGHDGEASQCVVCGAVVKLEWDGGVTFTTGEVASSPVYDYRNQAWLENGRYVRCGHSGPCDCYGRLHEGEAAALNAEVH